MKNNLALISPLIDNLNGYLQSMRRLSLNTCYFGAYVRKIKIDVVTEIDEFVNNLGDHYQLIDKKQLSFA
jgi:hypothetical protein